MNRTFIDRNRLSALQTGEVVFVLLDATVNGFSRRQDADVDQTLTLQGTERSVNRRQTDAFSVLSHFQIQILGGKRSPQSFQFAQNSLLAAGSAGVHHLTGVQLGLVSRLSY